VPEFDSTLAPAIEIEPEPVRLALPRFDAALKVSSSIRSPGDKDEVVRAVRSIANEWSVSEPMVAYRLHRIRQVSPAIYRELTSEYAARWNAQKQREKDKAKETEGGPSYYTVRQYKLGNAD
jgi:Zn-dependent peptidase ImmA (M78 family)